jgi:long-subunit acyl-CoA synthetase (AMP-forming)
MDCQAPFTVFRDGLPGGITLYDGRAVKRIPFDRLRADVCQARERLTAAGLEAGMCVGIVGENCYEWVVHDLAVLSLGCIPVCFPADEFREQPAETLAEDYDLSMLLVTRKGHQRPDFPWVVVMDAEQTPEETIRLVGAGRGLRRRVADTDVCTVIFSSGTSGQLKALLLSRAGVDVTIDALASAWQMGPRDGILVALPLSIFQQRLMIYAALRTSTEILLTDSVNLFRSFKALRPTILLGPPALFEAVEKRFAALSALRRGMLWLAGSALGVVPFRGIRDRLRRWLFRQAHEAFGGRARALITGSAPSNLSTLQFFDRAGLPLFQAYGLAEVGFIAWNLPGRNRFLSVGRPIIPGSVAIAEDGEVLVSVKHPQAVGYFKVDPGEEARTFLPDGCVATGDLGRFDGAGYLHLTGRKKNLILLQSGEKVNPERLEFSLGKPAGVDRVVVLGGGELAGLAAVVALNPGCTVEDEVRIRAEVRSTLRRVNSGVSPRARIERFLITRVAFHPDNGLVTRNLKVDRAAVFRAFEREFVQSGSRAVEVVAQ